MILSVRSRRGGTGQVSVGRILIFDLFTTSYFS